MCVGYEPTQLVRPAPQLETIVCIEGVIPFLFARFAVRGGRYSPLSKLITPQTATSCALPGVSGVTEESGQAGKEQDNRLFMSTTFIHQLLLLRRLLPEQIG